METDSLLKIKKKKASKKNNEDSPCLSARGSSSK